MSPFSLSCPVLLLGLAHLILSGAAGAQQPMPTATGNAAHDMMARLSPAERNRTLDRVLHSVNQGNCDVIESIFVQYQSGHAATWRATCSDGRRFVLDLMDEREWVVEVIACDKTVEQKARCEL